MRITLKNLAQKGLLSAIFITCFLTSISAKADDVLMATFNAPAMPEGIEYEGMAWAGIAGGCLEGEGCNSDGTKCTVSVDVGYWDETWAHFAASVKVISSGIECTSSLVQHTRNEQQNFFTDLSNTHCATPNGVIICVTGQGWDGTPTLGVTPFSEAVNNCVTS